MTITLYPTGYPPLQLDPDQTWENTQMLAGDKRGVRVTLYKSGDYLRLAVEYVSQWGLERNYLRVSKSRLSLEEVAADGREMAQSILPPGAGFPATPAFETRQKKLAGTMETLTLHAMTVVLAQAAS